MIALKHCVLIIQMHNQNCARHPNKLVCTQLTKLDPFIGSPSLSLHMINSLIFHLSVQT